MNRFPRKPHHPQSGFSLVEILVALTLGLVLLGGTIVIYASSKNSYRLQENVAGMQENARFAIFALRRDLEMAGYPLVNDIAPFRVGGGDTGDNVNGGSDRITIRYQSDTDCLGNGTPGTGPDEGIAVNRYFIDDNDNLACLGNSRPNNPQPLVENVVNMQILYGVDTDADGGANRYVSATQVEAGVISPGTPDWDRVVSLRVALLVASETAVDQPAAASGPSAPSISGPATESFALLDEAITRDDGRLYRVFTTTIPLRNRTS